LKLTKQHEIDGNPPQIVDGKKSDGDAFANEMTGKRW
jgi:hypothetical protein